MQEIIKIRSVVTLFLLNLVVTILCPSIIFLNENQILYAMSTLAQVIAGLFGLVLAAYAIIDPKLKEVGNQSKQSSDYVDALRARYFQNIIVLSIICAITILSSLLTINLYPQIPNKVFSILINQATVFGIFSIVCFLYFGCSLLNPNALENLGKEEKKEIEEGYNSSLGADDFKPFVAYYNKLESLIFDFATELMNKDLKTSQMGQNKNGRMQIFQALDILMLNEIINREIYEKINELRRYRNALVHSSENQKVKPQIFKELKELYTKLDDVFKVRDIQENKCEAIQILYQFGHEIALNQLEMKILDIVKENKNITMREIAMRLQVTQATVSRSIAKLINIGKIVRDESGFHLP